LRRTAMDVSVTPESTCRINAQLAYRQSPRSFGLVNWIDNGVEEGRVARALDWIGSGLESCAGVFDWRGWSLHNFTHNKNLKKFALNQSLIDLNQ